MVEPRMILPQLLLVMLRQFVFVLLPATLSAAPIITGFDRFHAGSETAEGGRLLFNELGCANCHGGETELPARRGPVLAGITSRVQSDWLLAFIAAPAQAKPGTTMPHLLEDAEAEAVLHYLAALPAKPAKPKTAKYMNAERGSDVYHTAGCVACHEPGKDYQPPAGMPKPADFTHPSVPLPDLKAKYSLASLSEFLTDPLKVRPDGRMPHVRLEASDVTDLAAHLLDMQQSDGSSLPGIKAFKPNAGLAAKGRQIVQSSRCAACHDLPKEVQSPMVDLKAATGGCLDSSSAKRLPRYDLSARQRGSIAAYLASRDKPIAAKTQAGLTLQALNCTQCHARDGIGGPDPARKAYFTGDHNLGDTGLLPPPLHGAGRKLQTRWMADVLSGKERVRPYLHSQMPVYGEATKNLPALLAKADAIEEKPLPAGEAQHGQKLLGTLGGLGCITCHRWADRPSLGIQSLDISNLAKRVQGPWLRDYLINPAAYRLGTLMPSFWPGGKAANQTILGGDTEAQIAAIFAFAKTGSGLPEGYPAMQAGEFELTPKDRPIIQRTFMEGVGAQAILVGFPAGLHLAYDAQHSRPALIWKGKFFDAYNTWFTRAAPFEKPLGKIIGRWPAASQADTARRFAGYKLDAKGTPSFLFDESGVRVEERFEPIGGELHRFVNWNSDSLASLAIPHPAEAAVREHADSATGKRHFIYSWK